MSTLFPEIIEQKPAIELRWYQRAAVDACWNYIRNNDDNPLIVLPTAAGKSVVLATLCRDAVAWGGRVLMLAHVKELLEQNADKLGAIAPDINFGIYSAGLKRRDTEHQVIIAGIQSVYNKTDIIGAFDIIIIDEAHLLTDSGEGMYRQLIDRIKLMNPDARIIGLTATPFRLGSGMICGPDKIFHRIAYEVGVKTLITQGFICPLVSKSAASEIDISQVKIVRGEYDEQQAETEFMLTVRSAVKEIYDMTADRKSVLIFCQTVYHANAVAVLLEEVIINEAILCLVPAQETFGGELTLEDPRCLEIADWLEDNGYRSEPIRRIVSCNSNRVFGECTGGVAKVFGETPAKERDDILMRFKSGHLKYLVNVGVLTTGFDSPRIDCVCLLRATVSAGLMYQMIGRGFRLHPSKRDCLVLDFGTNIRRHGPVDVVVKNAGKPKAAGTNDPGAKMCPECREMVATGTITCPSCQHLFERAEPKAKHNRKADDADVVSGEEVTTNVKVDRVVYSIHTKKGADEFAPKTLRVRYHYGIGDSVSEWVCVEHPEGTFANRKARTWWDGRCNFPMPDNVVEAWMHGQAGLLAQPLEVTFKVKPGDYFPEVTGVKLWHRPWKPVACKKCEQINTWVITPETDELSSYPGRVVCGECGQFVMNVGNDVVEHYGFMQDNIKNHNSLYMFDTDFTTVEDNDMMTTEDIF